jgi:uncharacterized protein involved in exopolysaccharide biosynthesis
MTSPTNPTANEITFAEFVLKLRSATRTVWAERRTVSHVALLSMAIGAFVAFGSGNEYAASTRLVPYKGSSMGGSSLSGLAGLAGIRLPTGSTEQAITVDLYPEVANSQDFRIVVAETPLRFSSLERTATTVEYFRELRKPALTELIADYTINLPSKAFALFSPAFRSTQGSVMDSSNVSAIPTYDPKYLRLVNGLADRLAVSVDKKTSIVTISAKMPDPYAAADLVRIAANRLTERIADYESRKASLQYHFIEEQYQRTKVHFERAQRELAVFADRNRTLMSATAKIEQERLQREYDLSFEVYQQLSRELEQSRIRMNQDTPVFTTIEQVVVPSRRSAPRRGRTLFVAALLGLMGGVGVIAWRRFLRDLELQLPHD